MASWNNLPVEIKETILGYVAGAAYPPHIYARDVASFNRVAGYAPVCKEWQTIFEHYSFNNLIVVGRRVLLFNEAMQGRNACRLRYVEKVKLVVCLPTYDCQQCLQEETLDEARLYFTEHLWQALLALARWHRPKTSERGYFTDGITFSIDILSPSDEEHAFHDLRNFMPTPPGAEQLTDQEIIDARSHITSTHHGWRNGARATLPPYNAVQRVFGRNMMGLWAENVFFRSIFGNSSQTRTFDIIRQIELGRQFQRTVHPGLLTLLVERCPRLEGLRLEQWRQPSADNFEAVRQGYGKLFSGQLPETMSTLTMFQDSSRENSPDQNAPWRVPCKDMAWSVAKASTKLQKVAVSYFFEADHFFEIIDPFIIGCACGMCQERAHNSPEVSIVDLDRTTIKWERLTHLALTSSTFSPASDVNEIRSLIESAALAVRRMPQLKVLEVWYAGDYTSDAAVFRYERGRSKICRGLLSRLPNILTLQATWDITDVMTPYLKKLWEMLCPRDTHDFVGPERSTREIYAQYEPLKFKIGDLPRPRKDNRRLDEHGGQDGRITALHNLVLRDHVIQPSSYTAMAWERNGEGQMLIDFHG